jgi:DNA-binding transcriptional MerR regulator
MKIETVGDTAASATCATLEMHDGFIRIGDMAAQHCVTQRTLRFYEDKGLLTPTRVGTTRLYTRRDSARLKLILLGRKIGFPLREVKKILDLYDPSGANIKQLKVALEKSEKQLIILQNQRIAIEEAIEEVNAMIITLRGKLAGTTPRSREES